MATRKTAASVAPIEPRIHLIRSQRVMLDADLAELYGVATKRFNEAVKRNGARFPEDFMFVLSTQEHTALRSQIATSNNGRGGRRYAPRAFSEHGAIMAATVLNSTRAIEMSLYVVRAFVRMRETISQNKEFARKLDELERRVERRLADQDGAILDILRAIREFTAGPSSETKKRPIGFVTPREKS